VGGLHPLTAREVVRILKDHGFIELRQRGSHLILGKGPLTATVPMHMGDVAMGTLRSIIKQTGLDRNLFER